MHFWTFYAYLGLALSASYLIYRLQQDLRGASGWRGPTLARKGTYLDALVLALPFVNFLVVLGWLVLQGARSWLAFRYRMKQNGLL